MEEPRSFLSFRGSVRVLITVLQMIPDSGSPLIHSNAEGERWPSLASVVMLVDHSDYKEATMLQKSDEA